MSIRLPGMTGDSPETETPTDAAGPMSGAPSDGGDDIRREELVDDAPASGSLLTELAGSGGGPSPAGKGKSMRGAGVLIAVAVCAGGVLFAMRHVGMNGHIVFAEKPIAIDYTFNEDNTLLDYERLMGDLGASGQFSQVELRDIHMNPFMWKQELRPEPEPTPEPVRQPQVDPEQERLNKNRQAIEAALSELRLSSVIGGTALISGQSYRTGDRLANGLFTVVAISGAGSQEGPRVTLEVAEGRRAEHRYYIIMID